jgi:branched-chain amino acid transport system ATP-binding protein
LLLTVDGVTAGYGRLEVLHDVSLSIDEGEIVTVLGPNGTGKTTLLRLLSGALHQWSGSIAFAGTSLTRLAPERRAALGLCQLPEGRGIFQTLSVGENLALGTVSGRSSPEDKRRDRDRVLGLFPELSGRLNAPAASLSGGQQQMLALARAVMSRPKLLMVDELSFGLAPRVVSDLFQVITELRDGGVTFLVVEQQAAALRISDRTYVMRNGRNQLERASADLLRSEDLVASYLRG